jgi:hypothetical protein
VDVSTVRRGEEPTLTRRGWGTRKGNVNVNVNGKGKGKTPTVRKSGEPWGTQRVELVSGEWIPVRGLRWPVAGSAEKPGVAEYGVCLMHGFAKRDILEGCGEADRCRNFNSYC